MVMKAVAQTRITSGAWRGRLVDSPRGERTMRPTTSLVRKALFDILGELVEGATFIDLFAGTAAVGFEALSRGADHLVAVERDPKLSGLIRATAQRLQTDRVRVVVADVPAWLRTRPADLTTADIVFLDAPYHDDVLLEALTLLAISDPGAPGSPPQGRSPLVVCEHHRARVLPEDVRGLRRRRQARYGTTQLTFYRRESQEPAAPPAGDASR